MTLKTIPGRDVGIHAFIVGVSDYANLPGDDDPPSAKKFGMKKLKTPALGAFRFLQWLIKADQENRLCQPLVSYEGVLAPSPEERAEPGLADHVDDATVASFIAKAEAWRERVKTDKNNVAVFYFSGHGIQRNKEDAVLMLQDFAKSKARALAGSVEFKNIFDGMAPSLDAPDMGLTQFYFVDACRNVPEQIKNFSSLLPDPVFDALNSRDDRAAPVFFAAVNDSVAFAQVGKGSFFNRSLMTALDQGAESFQNIDGRRRWPVSVSTLTTAITHEFSKFNTDQNFVPTGFARDCVLCYLDQPPPVDITIVVDPDQAREHASITLTQLDGLFVWRQPNPPPDHPYALTPPAGIHKIAATRSDGNPTIELPPQLINQRMDRVLRVAL